MGDHVEQSNATDGQLRQFTRCLLNDLHALEQMLSSGKVESGKQRIGAEQEMVLVGNSARPAPVADKVIARLDDSHFTTEIARFNIECNLDPLEFTGDCLRQMEAQLEHFVERVRTAAREFDADPVLVGILPTIRKRDLTLENMTPRDRYFMLNDALNRLRGGAYNLNIKGTDELILSHDNVMLEAANTSFQIHFQVDPGEFARRYNIAQVATAPVLSAAANSPFLGRYRLWRETRIAVFQQSIDTRKGPHERDFPPRVHFGNRWVDDSVLEIFQEDIARYKILFASDVLDDAFEVLESGGIPKLQALRLHNGTVYRWNRACYGASEGKAHLRIENRVLPAGPTISDQVANSAFWFGMMRGLAHTHQDVTRVMAFEDARDNFFSAARHGLGAQFTWFDGKRHTAKEVILNRLLPLAREGLRESGISGTDVDHYLGILQARVETEQTGAQWMLRSFSSMPEPAPTWEKLHALTAGTISRQKKGDPVHSWPLAQLEEAGGWEQNYLRVEQYMTTDLFTVQPHEPIDLVALLMVWNNIRHVLVEDEHNRLLGIVSHRRLLRLFGRPIPREEGQLAPVSSIMVANPVVITPETPSLDAIRLMKERQISCLPVVQDEKLVGVITEDNFLAIAGNLLEQKLASEGSDLDFPTNEAVPGD